MPGYTQQYEIFGSDLRMWGKARPSYVPRPGSIASDFMQWYRSRIRYPRADTVTLKFNEYLRIKHNWTWNPGRPGFSYRHGAQLLDGAVTQGECGYPVAALSILLSTDPPLGFGLGRSEISSYPGGHAEGFISPHGQHALRGVHLNILTPGVPTAPPYRLWENHKTVKFGGRYYDPNYNLIYDREDQMAVAHLQTFRDRVRLRDLRTYDWLTASGLLNLTIQKLSDLFHNTTHLITISQATGREMSGYYFFWTRGSGGRPPTGADHYIGPHRENPLAR